MLRPQHRTPRTWCRATSAARGTAASTSSSSALRLCWGLLGDHLGAATGQIGVAPLLAVEAFVVGLGADRGGFVAITLQPRPIEPAPFSVDTSTEQRTSPYPARPLRGAPEGEIIDVEYRVVS